MKAVTWLLSGGLQTAGSGECRLYTGSCLEGAGCDLTPVWKVLAVWKVAGYLVKRIQTVVICFSLGKVPTWLMSEDSRLQLRSCVEYAGCNFLSRPKQVASHVCNFGHTNQTDQNT